jgi:hypothetical protein
MTWKEPSEIEARASLGITFMKLDDDIEMSTFSMSRRTCGRQQGAEADAWPEGRV